MRMRRLATALAFLAGFLPTLAAAQAPPPPLPANSVWGRLGIGPGPSQAIPFATLAVNLFNATNLSSLFDSALCSTQDMFVVRGGSTWGCRTIAASDLPTAGATTLGAVFKLAYGDTAAAANGPFTTTSVLAGIDSAGNPQRAAVTGSTGPVVLKFSPEIDSANFLTAGYLDSVKFFDKDATYRYIYGPGAATFLQFSTTNAYVKRDNTSFTSSDGATTFADISSGGWNFYRPGGTFYHGSSSGSHQVVSAAAASGVSTWPNSTGTLLDTTLGQTITGGVVVTSTNAGTKSTGTFTPSCTTNNLQYAVNGGAHTLAPPSGDCTMTLEYTNNGSAGTITTSGFTKVTGDALTTTNGDDFLLFITVLNSFSHLHIQALQ